MTERKFVSRSEAKATGLTRFYTGPGVCGHDADKYVVNGACVDCMKEKRKNPPPPKAKAAPDGNPVLQGAGFKWNEDSRQRLIDAYVDTGDIDGARTTVGVTPSEYYRELARNPEFNDAVVRATVLAIQTFEDKSISQARRGNDKLILAVLKAKFPDQYTDRVKVDNTHTHTTKGMSDEEIDKRIARLSGGRTFDNVSRGKSPAIGFARGEVTEGSAEQDPEFLP